MMSHPLKGKKAEEEGKPGSEDRGFAILLGTESG
jgi:hypothetical protein